MGTSDRIEAIAGLQSKHHGPCLPATAQAGALDREETMSELSTDLRARRIQIIGLIGVPFLALIWAYWTTLGDISRRWASDPQYSHGYLVPFFALILLWLRRDRLQIDQMNSSMWGLVLIIVGLAARLVGAYYHMLWFDSISLLPCVAGLCLLLGGWSAWKWSWPAICFLFFMIPLPYSVATSLSGPLQKLATITSTYALQTFGLPALAEGNVILIDDARIGIVEACSGLRMLVVFFALSTALVLVVKRPIADKIILIFSAIPIALIANVIRVVVTGFLHVSYPNSEVAHVFFHDVAGWLMMPLALGLLWIELKILGRLFLDRNTLPGSPGKRNRSAPLVRSRRRTAPEPAAVEAA